MTQTKDIIEQCIVSGATSSGISVEGLIPEIKNVAECAVKLEDGSLYARDPESPKLVAAYKKLFDKIIAEAPDKKDAATKIKNAELWIAEELLERAKGIVSNERNMSTGLANKISMAMMDAVTEAVKNLPLEEEKTQTVGVHNAQAPKQSIPSGGVGSKRFPDLFDDFEAKKIKEDLAFATKREKEQKISFKINGALNIYLKSADAKTLAAELDKSMIDNNITLDKDFEKDTNVITFFPSAIRTKMSQVAVELEKRQAERGTFIGKAGQKIGDYAAIIVNVFSKLVGKKLDNTFLEAAVKECDEKTQEISKHLGKDDAKAVKVGKFASQVLEARQKNAKTSPIR